VIEVGEPIPLDGGHPIAVADTFAKLAANDYNVPAGEELVEEPKISPASEAGEAPKPLRSGGFIVDVLQREFGVLTREGEVEEFVKETDCALLTEATILVCSLIFFVPCRAHMPCSYSFPPSHSGYLSIDDFPTHIPRLVDVNASRSDSGTPDYQSRTVRVSSFWTPT
jgi:hypothetical protein